MTDYQADQCEDAESLYDLCKSLEDQLKKAEARNELTIKLIKQRKDDYDARRAEYWEAHLRLEKGEDISADFDIDISSEACEKMAVKYSYQNAALRELMSYLSVKLSNAENRVEKKPVNFDGRTHEQRVSDDMEERRKQGYNMD